MGFILTMRNVNMIDDVKLEKQLIGFILTMRNVNTKNTYRFGYWKNVLY